jgi:hypothetical protein
VYSTGCVSSISCTHRGRTLWILLWVAAGVLLSASVISACSWSYLIWAIRSESADPLFRFVRNGKAGYIDSQGKIVIQPTFSATDNFGGEFHEGLLGVKDDKGYRYAERSGITAFHADVWLAFNFSEGLAPASEDHRVPTWGFIDRSGKFVIKPQYSWADSFSEGLARVSVSSEVGSTGYIDRRGSFVIPPRLTYGYDFHEGLSAVIVEGPCQMVNGGSCARPEFRPTQPFASYDCRFTFVDRHGIPISTLRFDDAKDFSEGVAPVRSGRQWGFVDRSGQISISPRFDSAEPFSEGLAPVIQGGKSGFINHSGDFVIPPQFEATEQFSNGRALVSEGGEKGIWRYRFIAKNGRAAFPGVYAAAASFRHGLAPVAYRNDRRGTLAWINTSGNVVFTFNESK